MMRHRQRVLHKSEQPVEYNTATSVQTSGSRKTIVSFWLQLGSSFLGTELITFLVEVLFKLVS